MMCDIYQVNSDYLHHMHDFRLSIWSTKPANFCYVLDFQKLERKSQKREK